MAERRDFVEFENQTDLPEDPCAKITESVSTLTVSENTEEKQKSNSCKHKLKNLVYHPKIQEEIDRLKENQNNSLEAFRLFKLAEVLNIYMTIPDISTVLSRLDCRQVSLTEPVKKSLLGSANINSDYDKQLVEKFTNDLLDVHMNTPTPDIEVYRTAYNVYNKIHSKLLHKANNKTLNEITLMIETVSELVKAYIATYCKDLLDVEYNPDPSSPTHGCLQIMFDAQNHSLPLLVCEVSAIESISNDTNVVAHKCNGMSLITTMKRLLKQQLNHVPLSLAGVFGILVGEFNVRVLFMNAIHEQDLWAYPIVEIDAFSLKDPRGYNNFFHVLAQAEALALELKKVMRVRKFSHDISDTSSNSEMESPPSSSSSSSGSYSDKDDVRELVPNIKGKLIDISEPVDNWYLGYWKHRGTLKEVFIITKTKCDAREIEFLQEIKCASVVELLHSQIQSKNEDEVTYTMVLPRLVMYNRSDYGLANHLRFARDILEAMSYIHEKYIVHRDIKPSNIGWSDEHNKWVLFDFNNATRLLEENNFKSFSEGVGTEGYQAPEVLNVDPGEGYDDKADVFSFGKVLKEMCVEFNSDELSGPIKFLIDLCLKEDPYERFSASDLLKIVKGVLDKVLRKERKLRRKKKMQEDQN